MTSWATRVHFADTSNLTHLLPYHPRNKAGTGTLARMKEGTCINQKTVHSSPAHSIPIQTPIPVKLPSLANTVRLAGSLGPDDQTSCFPPPRNHTYWFINADPSLCLLDQDPRFETRILIQSVLNAFLILVLDDVLSKTCIRAAHPDLDPHENLR